MAGSFIVAFVVAVIGAFLLTKVTAGVGLICFGCLFGILGRVCQANAQHNELKKLLEGRPAEVPSKTLD